MGRRARRRHAHVRFRRGRRQDRLVPRVREHARGADVFIANDPPARARKLGISYQDLAAVDRQLVSASITSYGETGPEADKLGFDINAWWARSGLIDMVRAVALPSGSAPGTGDHPTAMALFTGIMWRSSDARAPGAAAGSARRSSPKASGRTASSSRRCSWARPFSRGGRASTLAIRSPISTRAATGAGSCSRTRAMTASSRASRAASVAPICSTIPATVTRSSSAAPLPRPS
ncbi:MAG: hypothetical protein C5B48_08675 [Candidatus Rokuibacteriota bacterium]|nr:MAG: hypothetical protein C5B48_08675 [Candidatus Rokubacteria bacterium]